MEKKSQKSICYILQFIDSPRFMAFFLNEFTELNLNSDFTIKDVKHVKLNISIEIFLLNTQILKII